MARTMTVGLEYDLPPARARAALEAAARDVSGVAAVPAPASYLLRFHDFAVEYELRYWLEDYAHYLEIDSRVRERVWYRLEREGIPIAYPLVRQRHWAMEALPGPNALGTVLAAIEASALFAPLSAGERLTLAGGARLVRFDDGETVVREGDTGSSMFLIAAGRAGVSVRGEVGASRKVAVLDAGASFGEISLLTGEPRLATVRAMTEATLVEIDKATLAPVLVANLSLVEKLDAVIRERRRHTADQLVVGRDGLAAEEREPLRGKIARFFGLMGL
jgi:CRP-like cAMP-binding protein